MQIINFECVEVKNVEELNSSIGEIKVGTIMAGLCCSYSDACPLSVYLSILMENVFVFYYYYVFGSCCHLCLLIYFKNVYK